MGVEAGGDTQGCPTALGSSVTMAVGLGKAGGRTVWKTGAGGPGRGQKRGYEK